MTLNSKQQDKVDAMRNYILTKLLPENVCVGDMKKIECETVITTMYERLCHEFLLLYSITTWQDCCETTTDSPFVRFRLKNLQLSDIQRSTYSLKTRKKCLIC